MSTMGLSSPAAIDRKSERRLAFLMMITISIIHRPSPLQDTAVVSTRYTPAWRTLPNSPRQIYWRPLTNPGTWCLFMHTCVDAGTVGTTSGVSLTGQAINLRQSGACHKCRLFNSFSWIEYIFFFFFLVRECSTFQQSGHFSCKPVHPHLSHNFVMLFRPEVSKYTPYIPSYTRPVLHAAKLNSVPMSVPVIVAQLCLACCESLAAAALLRPIRICSQQS